MALLLKRHKGISRRSNTDLLLPLVMLCTLMFSAVAVHAGTDVAVILSDTLPAYQEAVNGMEEELSKAAPPHPTVTTELMNLAGSSRVSLARRLKKNRYRVIVSVGTQATISTIDMGMGIPIVFSMVLAPPDSVLHKPGVTGVLLDIPPSAQMEWIRKITPGSNRIGIIHTKETENWMTRAAVAAPGMGFRVVPLKLEEVSQLPSMLDRLEKEADVLLAVPDGEIYNSIISPQIILFCLQHKIPFIGLSSNFTRAGALFALNCDYSSIGKQTGDMVKQILNGKSPDELPHRYPDKLIPCFNMRTARILGIDIDKGLLENAIIFAD